MSILRKVPKIEQVLDNMSIESLKRLESLMNSGNGATVTYTLFGGENKLNYENKDLGVWYCNIELERNKSVETGFLIWESSTKALFISFDITQCLKEYEIDLTNYSYTKINEKLSIEEFRRVLEDNINKEVVHIDTSGNVEVGKNLVVDGKVILNGKEDLVDTSGNELISSGGEKHLYYTYIRGYNFNPKYEFYIFGYFDHIINGGKLGLTSISINSTIFSQALQEFFDTMQQDNFILTSYQKNSSSSFTRNLMYDYSALGNEWKIKLFTNTDGVEEVVLNSSSSPAIGQIQVVQIF